MTTTITVTSLAGGTGKTTLIANLAATFATHYQQRVLAVDLTTSNQLLQQFALYDRTTAYFLDDPFRVGAAGIEKYIVEYAPMLHLLPGTNPMTEYMPIYGPQEDGIWLRLKKGFQFVQERYDFILIDAPRGWDSFAKRACALADLVLVPNGFNTNEVRSLEDLFRRLEKVQTEYALPAQQTRIVLHRDTPMADIYGKSYQQKYSHRLLHTGIHQSELACFSVGKLQPAVLRHPDSQMAQDYNQLAEEIMEMVGV